MRSKRRTSYKWKQQIKKDKRETTLKAHHVKINSSHVLQSQSQCQFLTSILHRGNDRDRTLLIILQIWHLWILF